MEDAISSLLDQGLVDEDEAHAALMKTTDESSDETDYGSSSKSKASRQAEVQRSDDFQDDDGGYSF